MNLLLVLPVLVPMTTASLMLLSYRHERIQRALGLIGSAALLMLAGVLLHVVATQGIQAGQIGDWKAPFGITLIADLLSCMMIALASVVGAATTVYSLADVDRPRRVFGFYPLTQVLLMGTNGVFLAGDLFNLYVWFEVTLISSFVLLVLGNERRQMEGAIKYVTLNLLASALFLTAVGILYGSVGALNLAHLSLRLPLIPEPVQTTLAMLFLVAFGIKAAVFPLFFWLPDSYHTPPTTITALFAGVLTKVGVYSLVRVFTLLFTANVPHTHGLILLIAGLTMTVGVLGAVSQSEVRRILAFHSVSQVGYMIMGLGLYRAAGIAGALYFVLHHGVVKTTLFLIGGAMGARAGPVPLKTTGGLLARKPVLAAAFLVSALSLAGVPPLSGFWAKLGLVRAGLGSGSTGAFTVVAASLGVGLFTLISMMKIWNEAFWKPAPEASSPAPAESAPAAPRYVSIALLVATALLMGLLPEPLMALAKKAGRQLVDPSDYVRAVMGDARP